MRQLSLFIVSALMTFSSLCAEDFPTKEFESIPDSRFTDELMNMLYTLGLLVLFLFFVSWGFRRLMSSRIQQMNTTSDIKILETRQVSTKLLVHMIQVRGKNIVFAESASGVDKLSEFPAESRTFKEVMDE